MGKMIYGAAGAAAALLLLAGCGQAKPANATVTTSTPTPKPSTYYGETATAIASQVKGWLKRKSRPSAQVPTRWPGIVGCGTVGVVGVN